jgi:hypothetical protein
MRAIQFITEYASGDFRYLALKHQTELECSEQGCDLEATCTLYDVEGDPIPYCQFHIESLHEHPDNEGWTKNDWNNVIERGKVVAEWIRLNPFLFLEDVPAYDPEQAYNH